MPRGRPFGVPEFQVAEDGLDRGQTHIAGTYTVVRVALEVLEEGEQRRGLELPDLQLARSDRVAA